MKSRLVVQPYGVVVTFTNTPAEFDSLSYNDDCMEGCAGGFDWQKGKSSSYVIGVFDGKLMTLVHESVHAASALLKDCGIDPQSNEAEPLAYLVDYLTAAGSKRLKLSHLHARGVTPGTY